MVKSQFQLEVYEPDDNGTVVGCWPIEAPINMAVGDVINTAALQPDAVARRLRVVQIEHALWPRDGLLAHKLMVFTALE